MTFGRDPLPGAARRYEAPARTSLPGPARLTPVPELSALQADPTPSGRAQTQLLVEVRDLDPTLRRGAAGVSTFRAESGADYRWQPLAAGAAAADGAWRFSVRAEVGADLVVTLASASDRARHGYLTRRVVVVEPGATVQLSGARHEVRFDLPQGIDQAGPLRLQRVDDRDWLPMEAAPSGLRLRSGTTTTLRLGAGRYELQDPLAPSAVQPFEVPAPSGAIVLRRPLARAPGDRR